VALASLGCLDAFEPETGPLLVSPCENIDSNPDVSVSFRVDILEGIFQREEINCVRCHTPGGETPIGIEATGFDVSNRATLLRGGNNTGAGIVITGQPCDSLLVQKVSAAPPIGSRMPLPGPPFLSDRDQQQLKDWIAEGARDN
jgi:mono/diheme cytochrome c family protein